MSLNLAQFANQQTQMTAEEVQQLIDSASGRPMDVGVHECTVVAIPMDKIAQLPEPNDHLLKFNLKLENVAGESIFVYNEISLVQSKAYKINKEGEQRPQAIGRHIKTFTALGVPTSRMSELITRIVETNAECLQGFKGFKCKVTVKRNSEKFQLKYDSEVGAHFITRNSDNVRVDAQPFHLSGKGAERYAEAEIYCRENNFPLELMPQVDIQALQEVENDCTALFGAGKTINKVAGGVVSKSASVKVSTPVAKPVTAKAPPPTVKPVVAKTQPTTSAPESLPSDEELDNMDDAVDSTEA